MRDRKRIIKTALAMGVIALFTMGASECGGSDQSEAEKTESNLADKQLDQYGRSQPVPFFNASQLRQNMIDIETAQANATVTTSLFFNLGVKDPVHVCPSIGFPIPGTFQLTNPLQVVDMHETSSELPQLEANGVYTGDTSATTVICIDANGAGYAFWWEGTVATLAGPAEYRDGTIALVGDPSAEFSTGGN